MDTLDNRLDNVYFINEDKETIETDGRLVKLRTRDLSKEMNKAGYFVTVYNVFDASWVKVTNKKNGDAMVYGEKRKVKQLR